MNVSVRAYVRRCSCLFPWSATRAGYLTVLLVPRKNTVHTRYAIYTRVPWHGDASRTPGDS